jgi:hypothetical protein
VLLWCQGGQEEKKENKKKEGEKKPTVSTDYAGFLMSA